MKFKKLLSWSVPAIMYGTVLISAGISGTNGDLADSDAGTVTTFSDLPELTVVHDTIYVSYDDVFTSGRKFAWGQYMPSKRRVETYAFIPTTPEPQLAQWCTRAAENEMLSRRHELEHARKVLMVKNTIQYSPYVRGQIAAMNEIMAPGAEIIAGAEHWWKTGEIPNGWAYRVKNAVRQIAKIHQATTNRFEPIDFARPEIADIVLLNALAKFTDATRGGTYIAAMRRAWDEPSLSGKAHNHIYKNRDVTSFNPAAGAWGPLFSYQTARGNVSIWNHASPAARNQVIDAIDTLMRTKVVPGQNIEKPKTQQMPHLQQDIYNFM